MPLRRQYDTVDPLREERLEVAVLLVDVLVGVSEQRDVIGTKSGLFGGVGDIGEERIAHVGYQ